MGAKTIVKRQNIALLDRSKDIVARHKIPGNGFMHHIMTEDITWTYSYEQKSKLVSKQLVQHGTKPQKISKSNILI